MIEIIWLVCGFIGACMAYGIISQAGPGRMSYSQAYYLSNLTIVVGWLASPPAFLLTAVMLQLMWTLAADFKFKLKLPFTELTEMKEKYFNE